MKRTCNNCRALSLGRCELGHPILALGYWPHRGYRPIEDCEKPRTIQEYLRLTLRGADVATAASNEKGLA